MPTTTRKLGKAFISSRAHGQMFDDLDCLVRRLLDAQAPKPIMETAFDLQDLVQTFRESLLRNGFEREAELLQEQICPGDAPDYDPD